MYRVVDEHERCVYLMANGALVPARRRWWLYDGHNRRSDLRQGQNRPVPSSRNAPAAPPAPPAPSPEWQSTELVQGTHGIHAVRAGWDVQADDDAHSMEPDARDDRGVGRRVASLLAGMGSAVVTAAYALYSLASDDPEDYASDGEGGVDMLCLGCYDKTVCTVHTGCGHASLCMSCSTQLSRRCPVCRCSSGDFRRLYVSGMKK